MKRNWQLLFEVFFSDIYILKVFNHKSKDQNESKFVSQELILKRHGRYCPSKATRTDERKAITH